VKHKAFISYHHGNDQQYKEALLALNAQYGIFVDQSVDTGDISDELDDEAIRTKIRDEYLRDTTVTIVLVGTETKKRKHVDWEICSSMVDGSVNNKSGVLVINLPSVSGNIHAAHGDDEKRLLYPEIKSWTSFSERSVCERRHPYAPRRIVDNLLAPKAKVSVVPWDTIAKNPEGLAFVIDATFSDRQSCVYDLSTPMRTANS